MLYTFGEVLLLSLGFSDASAAKRRPVLVVCDTQDADILVAPITSHPARSGLDVTLKEWRGAGLRLPSTVRIAKLTTVAKSIIVRKLGGLRQAEALETQMVLRIFLQQIEEAADSVTRHG